MEFDQFEMYEESNSEYSGHEDQGMDEGFYEEPVQEEESEETLIDESESVELDEGDDSESEDDQEEESDAGEEDGSEDAADEDADQHEEVEEADSVTISGNDIITISGNAVIFPEDFDFSILQSQGSYENEAVDLDPLVEKLDNQTNLIFCVSAVSVFLLGLIAGLLFVQGFRLRRV